MNKLKISKSFVCREQQHLFIYTQIIMYNEEKYHFEGR